MKLILSLLVFVLIVATLASNQDYSKNCTNDCTPWEIIIVGEGFGGVGFTYYADLVKRLSAQTGIHVNQIDLSKVLMLESRNQSGGNARTITISRLDPELVERTRELYNYTGPFVYDIGPQRTPQLTCKLDRCTAIDSETIEEYTPYYTYEDSRERLSICPVPDISNYDVTNPYGIVGSCTTDFPFYGDSSVPWQYNNWIGPAYNLTDLQDWAYLDQGGLNAVNSYLLYDGPNPVTCSSADATCQECGDCFTSSCSKYKNLKAALIGQLGHGVTNLFIQDFAGFYVDFEANTNDPCAWAHPYYYRDFSTDAINGYVVGGTTRYIQNLLKPIKAQGGTVLLNKLVTKIESAGGYKSVVVTTSDGQVYRGKFLIYAAPPDGIALGKVTGNLAVALNNTEAFKSVYCVTVTTVTVTLDYAYWKNIVPKESINSTVKRWVQLRSFGEEGHVPRSEVRYTVYGGSMIAFRASYTDYLTKEVLNKMQNIDTFGDGLWRALRNDLSYAFQVDDIPQNYVDIHVENFDNGWCYINSSTTLTADQIRAFAVAPLGPNVPIALVHQAWAEEFLGWKEAALRTAVGALDRLVPGAATLIDCWMEATFPPCDPVDSCYNDPTVYISGSESIIPSRYCSEHWFNLDYEQTPGCIERPIINASTCVPLLKQKKMLANRKSPFMGAAKKKKVIRNKNLN